MKIYSENIKRFLCVSLSILMSIICLPITLPLYLMSILGQVAELSLIAFKGFGNKILYVLTNILRINKSF